QLATSLPDLMRHALRRAFCSEAPENCFQPDWMRYDGRLALTGKSKVPVAIGPEASAILDRLPLRLRMEASATLPEPLRLD
ncbi:hypothetical protein, partial [Escherichia coli]